MSVYRQTGSILKLIQRTVLTNPDARSIKRWVSPTLRELKRRKDRYGPQPELPKSSFLEWNYQAEIYAFGKRLNEEFDKNLLQNALVNRSYIIQEEARQQKAGIENPQIGLEDNTALIKTGEEFIINCVRKQLKLLLPKFPKEGLDAVCEYLTSIDSLANIAMHIGLKDLILCGEYPPNTMTMSSTFKAVVAVLGKTSGDGRAEEFVHDFVVLKQLSGKDVNTIWHVEKPLEMLKNLLDADLEPRLCNHSAGNTILAAYQVGLYLEKRCVGLGWGESIDVAIEMAARDGLKRIFGTTDASPALQNVATHPTDYQQNVVISN